MSKKSPERKAKAKPQEKSESREEVSMIMPRTGDERTSSRLLPDSELSNGSDAAVAGPIRTVEAVAAVMAKRGPKPLDVATVEFLMPKPNVTAMFVGPFALDTVVAQKVEQWKRKLEDE